MLCVFLALVGQAHPQRSQHGTPAGHLLPSPPASPKHKTGIESKNAASTNLMNTADTVQSLRANETAMLVLTPPTLPWSRACQARRCIRDRPHTNASMRVRQLELLALACPEGKKFNYKPCKRTHEHLVAAALEVSTSRSLSSYCC
jgi:hypothetical protein